jgi:hypothetical protein
LRNTHRARLRASGTVDDVEDVDGARDCHPDVIAPAPDFGVGAGGSSGTLLLGEAAFKPADDGSPRAPAAAAGTDRRT